MRGPKLKPHVTSGIADTERTRFTADYRAYLSAFGRAIGSTHANRIRAAMCASRHDRPDVQAAIHASRLDIVTERLAEPGDARGTPAYDLVIVTNVFPYLSIPS